MTKTESIESLEALNQAVKSADIASVASLAVSPLAAIMEAVTLTPDVALAERQAKARIGYLDRAIRSNGAAPPTNDIEKLRRRAARAISALQDVIANAPPTDTIAAAG